MKDYTEMTKKELLSEIEVLNNVIESRDFTILDLQEKLSSNTKSGRKSQVLDLLKSHETISILEIADKLNISTKNVSSQLTYLRSDGHQIFTDSKGRKMLYNK